MKSRYDLEAAQGLQAVPLVIADSRYLGGKPAVRGTRLSVAQILECLGAGMTLDDINESFGGGVTPEALAEALDVAAELADNPCVAP